MPFEFGGSPTPPKTPAPSSKSSPLSGNSPSRTGGFADKPSVSSEKGNSLSTWSPSTSSDAFRSSGATGVRGGSSPKASRGSGFSMPDIPWGIILTIIAAIGIIAFLWTYRAAIASFLYQVISWVVMIAIILVVLRLLLFGRR